MINKYIAYTLHQK